MLKINNKLQVSQDDPEGSFIKSIHNKLEDSWRSPVSNEYYPITETYGKYPPQELRFIEVEMGKLLKVYCKLYYGENAISSVYCWELGDSLLSGFGVSILITNESDQYEFPESQYQETYIDEETNKNDDKNKNKKNFINSINIYNVKFFSEIVKGKEYIKASYKLNSTMVIGIESKEGISFGSTLSRNFEENHEISDISNGEFHIKKLGKALEHAENVLRLNIEEVEFKKFHEIITDTKPDPSINEQRTYFKGILDSKKFYDKEN
jgi:capping protein beta